MGDEVPARPEPQPNQALAGLGGQRLHGDQDAKAEAEAARAAQAPGRGQRSGD
ncbi:hypothetical protein [Streptomyces sp. AK010]|uniref:hypothetical protein n=1 Tax=Streptomyces sp. AK010 TaxID=2723074 RepID=UPI0018501CD3|nr:hypothetical protein [Streptomyces sp. AK010]MBB6415439.1 hypothetical protein [Streptomyces sp. AK010]